MSVSGFLHRRARRRSPHALRAGENRELAFRVCAPGALCPWGSWSGARAREGGKETTLGYLNEWPF